MEKRVVVRSAWLPYVLVAPQLVVTLLFFIWPAAQALYQSVFVEDAFGTHVEFVGLANFRALLEDPHYAQSFGTTAIFAVSVAALSLGSALLLAVLANRVVRGGATYKTLIIWPYAVAPAVAGVL